MKYIALTVLVIISAYFLRDTIPSLGYSAYVNILSTLLNISSIIFAIIGAWIAIIYPRAIGKVFNNKSPALAKEINDSETDTNYLSELVEIVVVSAFVLMLILLIQFSAPILREIIEPAYVLYVKFGAFILIALLTLSQLIAIFGVIKTNYFFLNELRNKNNEAKADDLKNR